MLLAVLPILLAAAAADEQCPAFVKQLPEFKENTECPGILTTSTGAPVTYEAATSTLNKPLLRNEHFLDEITNIVRQRLPERIVHGSGTGATGYFEVTHDISHICKAKLFSEVGKRTPVAARFSISFSRSGTPDTTRELRSFALKFYTEEGNLDFTGINTPIFAFNDPLMFNAVTHVVQANPVTGLTDPNMVWDLATLHPETIFLFMHVYSDYGMPVGYKHMTGFPIHTYQVYNENGTSSFMRFHILPVAGTYNFNNTGAAAIAASNPNFYARSLYNSIANGEYPKWYIKAQIMSEEDVKNSNISFFDVTRTIPTDKFPLHEIGILTLDKNPVNYHAEIEQVAFCPNIFVPGMLGSPDKLFEGRCLAYKDAQNYRLGKNYQKIAVNRPKNIKTLTYTRDGVAPVDDNGKGAPHYYPNSFKGPEPIMEKNRPSLYEIYETTAYNTDQAGEYYENLSNEQRSELVMNILATLCLCEDYIKTRAVERFTDIHSDFGERIAQGLATCTNSC